MSVEAGLRRTLWRKYAAVMATLTAGGLLLLGATELVSSYRAALDETRVEQQRAATDVAYALRLTFSSIEQQLGAVAVLPWEQGDWLGVARRREEFHRLLLLVPALVELRLLAPDGTLRLAVSRRDPDTVAPVAGLPPTPPAPAGFTPAFHYGQVRYADGYEPRIELTLTVSDRAAERTEATIGLRPMARDLRRALSPEGRAVYVVDAADRVVLHADPAVMLEQRRRPPADGAGRAVGLQGGSVMIALAPVQGLDWRVVVERPREQALAPVWRTLWRTAAFIAAGLLVAVAASLLLARRMTRPIAALQAAAGSLGRGDLGARIDLHTGDELDDLATQFNRMAASLQANVTDLEDRIAARTLDLQRANRHKSDFLANMSHELRTPLNAILGFADVLNEGMAGPLSAEQREYIGDIHASGMHLLALINDVLDLAKIEAGQLELELADFDVPETVASAAALVRHRCLHKGLVLAIELAPEVGLWVGDARRFKQVLVNLLTNAVKFTPAGGTVCLRAAVDAGLGLCVEVQDSGIGIAPADHAAVFEEFRQVGADLAGRAEGTGLGLALVRRLVEQHGGRVTLTSELGAGATLRFNLPRHGQGGAP
jgi:signal transduction histidine kinase